jgi:hypothetical protein
VSWDKSFQARPTGATLQGRSVLKAGSIWVWLSPPGTPSETKQGPVVGMAAGTEGGLKWEKYQKWQAEPFSRSDCSLECFLCPFCAGWKWHLQVTDCAGLPPLVSCPWGRSTCGPGGTNLDDLVLDVRKLERSPQTSGPPQPLVPHSSQFFYSVDVFLCTSVS